MSQPIQELLSHLSPEKRALLQRRLQQRQTELAPPPITAQPRTGEDRFPLSFAQQRLWFLNQWDPTSPAYHVPALFQLNGTINAEAMRQALAALVARHEVLRTTIVAVDDEPQQVIQPPYTPDLLVVDLQGCTPQEQHERIQSLQHDQHQRPFDLASEPVLRALLVQTGPEAARLLVTIHHIACDGWSMDILLREISTLYQGYVAGEAVTLPPLLIQYADYAQWHRALLQGPRLQAHLDYWQKQLGGTLPVLALPTDFPRPAIKRDHGAAVSRALPAHLIERLEHLSRQEHATLFMTLMAAFQTLLSRYSGQTDLVVGTPIANRQRIEIEGLIGFFVNTLAIRGDLSGNPTFRTLLRQMRQTALAAYEHQDLPLEQLIETLNIPRNLSHTPMFQALFVLQNMMQLGTMELPEFDMRFAGNEANGAAKFDLTLNVSGHTAQIEYNTDLFTRATAERMLDHWQVLLEGIAANSDTPINNLPLLTVPEQQQLLQQWNATETTFPAYASVVALFEEQAARWPERPAVHFEDQSLSYAELNARANQLAHALRARGVAPDQRIGLFIDRSLELMIGALGILKAGAAYVPIDPIYPTDRIEVMIEDAAISLLLTTSDLVAELPTVGIAQLVLDRDWGAISMQPTTNPAQEITPQHLMYVLFTSGSTGRPKGVAIEHGNYLNYIQAIRQRLSLSDGLSYALVSTFAADLGTTNVYGALCTGGELHIIAYERATDPTALIAYFQRHRIDVMKLVPSHFEALQSDPAWPDAIPQKLLILAGEASSWDLISKIRQARPDVALENHYGPTETTVSMLTYAIPEPFPVERSAVVPLGRPLANVKIYVVDSAMQPVPVGVPGELLIGGAGVARGYLNRPEQTRERFVSNPWKEQAPFDRLYRTGDLVRYRANGTIEFLGRIDQQVKIRGYRVELSEIETLLEQHPALQEAVVTLREDLPGDKRLVAYYVARDAAASISTSSVREHLRKHLPDYMIPSVFVPLAAIPLNLNGKVDRFALPAPDPTRRDTSDELVAPRTPTEQSLAALWSEILQIEQIGIDDNFFDLGGESFKAIRVVRRLESSISVMDLFKYPTIRELAEHITAAMPSSSSLLFDLTPQVPKARRTATVIAVPYGGGSAIIYQPLAKALPKGFGLYSIALPGHDWSRRDEPLEALPLIAERCVAEIKANVQGPIVLYGHCVGCALTVEIARLLEREQIAVSGVILGGNFPAPRLPGRVFEFLAKIFPADRWMSDRMYRDLLRALGGFTEIVDPAEQQFVMQSLRHDAREVEDYHSKVFNQPGDYSISAPIVCVIGEMDRATEFYSERYREWERFSANVGLEVLPGAGHYFLKHQATEVAAIIAHHTAAWQQPAPVPAAVASTPAPTPPAPATPPVRTRQAAPSLRIFFLIAIGQLISMIGSSFTGFALGVWMYQQTGSVSTFATIGVIAVLPAILIAPFAGAVADRYDRRRIMITTDSIAAIATLTLGLLVWRDQLAIWHLYVAASITSIAGTFQRPAYVAAMTQLVPKSYLGKANGLIQLSAATGGILAPILGGALVMLVGLSGIFVIDVVSFLVAVSTLLVVRFPDTLFKKRDEPLLRQVVHGWEYIRARPNLIAMVVFFALGNVWFGLASILIAPLVLSYATPAEWGWVSAASALGMLSGGVLMSLWGGTARRAEGMVGFVILEGLFIALIGLRPSPLVAAIGMFGMWACVTLVNAHWQVLIQTKVGLELQGRVQATNQMLAMISIPLGYVLAGPLADRLFEPLMTTGGTLAPYLGWLFGTGEGRGMGLMMCVIGLIAAGWAWLGFNYRPLRYMEDHLPDAIPDAIIPKLNRQDAKDAKNERLMKIGSAEG